jgi:CheY-like chemotaxis protein/HPt (histidine-containing phosphotransfer) domain-containing protein
VLGQAAARAAGVDRHMSKPVRRHRLLETVGELLGDGRTGRVPAAPAPVPLAAAAHAARPSRGIRVLVADDNEVNQMVIVGMLARHGIQAEAVADGVEAIEALRRERYDGVFMDCQMPRLDGYEATGRIRAGEGAGRHVPIIAMTAHAMEGDRERCLAAGMDDYLAKPIRAEALEAVLARWLGIGEEDEDTPDGDGSGEVLVDAERVRGFTADYPELLEQLLELFAEGTPPLLEELETAAARGDADALARAAHKLKGSCQNMGATAMAEACRRLERGEADAPEEVARLDALYGPTLDELRRLTPAPD